jgi:four helix bundle protein
MKTICGGDMVNSFEDLDVWKEGCTIAVEIYGATNVGKFAKDFALRDQIRRASVSIPSNIAEGKERETVNELIRYLYIAKGSAGELKTQIFISHKVGYMDHETYTYFSERILNVSKMLGSFIRMLKRGKSEKGVRSE